MRQQLLRFEDLLGERQHPLERRLEPGVDDAQLDAVLAGRLPPPLRELYRWRDPPGLLAEPDLTDDTWVLLKLDEAVQAFAELRGQRASGGEFVPFLRNGNGDLRCVVVAEAPGAPLGSVVETNGGEGVCLRFGSLARWLELAIDGLERGLLVLDPGGGLHPSDPFEWEAYLLERNPGYQVGDPVPENEDASAGRVGVILRNVATGLGTLLLVTLAVTVKVFRRQLPRATFVAILLGLLVAALFLLTSQILIKRHRRSQDPGPPVP